MRDLQLSSSRFSQETRSGIKCKRKVCELESNSAVSVLNENGITLYLGGKYSKAKQSFVEALATEVEISSKGMMHSSISDRYLKLKASTEAHSRAVEENSKLLEKKNLYIYQRQHYDEGMHIYGDALHIYDSLPVDLRLATLQYNIGLACVNSEQYEEAKSWFELAMATMDEEDHFSGTSVNIVKVQHNIGHCFYRLGKNEEAMRHYQRALVHVGKLELGKIALAAACNCVAVLYCHNPDNLTKAMGFFQFSLSTYRTIIGDCTKEVGTILNNIGRVHFVLAEYDKAMLVYEKALKTRRQVLGNDSVDVAATIFNTGQTYHQLGKLDEAMKCYEDFVNLVASNLGSKNRDIASAYKCMGRLCTQRDEVELACGMYKLALESERVVFGENHPKVASTLHDIGVLSFRMSDSDAALKYFREELDIEKQSCNQSDTILTLLNIVQVYKHNGDFVNALKVYKEIRMHQIKIHGYISLEVATTLTSIGWMYYMLDSFSNSLKYRQEALHVRRDYHGSENHLDVAKEWHSIGLIYSKIRKYGLSRDAFMKSIEIRQNLFGVVHEEIAVLWFNVGTVCMAAGDDEQGIRCYKESLRQEQKIHGDDHPHTSPTLQQIAEVHQSRGEFDEAIWYYNRVLDIEKKNKGSHSVFVSKLLNLIGNIHLMNGNVGSMMQCYSESVRSRMSCQESEHDTPPLLFTGSSSYRLGKLHPTCAPIA